METLELVLKTSLVLVAAGAVTLTLRKSSAAMRHLIWTLALLGVVVLPAVSGVLPWEWNVVPRINADATAETAADEVAATSGPPVAIQQTAVANRNESRRGSGAVVAPTSQPPARATAIPAFERLRTTLNPSWPRILLGGWIVGALLVLGRFAIGLLWLAQLTGRAREIESAAWKEAARRVGRALGLRRQVTLLRSEDVQSPMAHGLFKPVVLLPTQADAWTTEQRDMALIHELAHIRRLDVIALVIARLACAIYWFNPLVWVAASRARAAAERACDDWVLETGARASSYAGYLMQMASTLGASRRAYAAALPMASRSGFEGRLFAILAPNQTRHNPHKGHSIMSVIGIGGLTVILAAMAPAAPEADTTPDVGRMSVATDRTTRDAARMSIVTDAKTRDVGRGSIATDAETHEAGRTSIATNTTPRDPGRTSIETDVERAVDAERTDVAVTFVLSEAPEQSAEAATTVQVEDPRSVAALSRSLRTDTDAGVRKTAAWALGQLEDRAGVEALSDALRSDQDAEVRKTAAWALGQIEDASAVPGLMTAMSDQDVEVRSTAVWALGQIEDRTAVAPLAEAMSDSDVSIRKSAAWALGQIESREAVAPLAVGLRDENVDVRMQSAWALGQIESSDAVDALVTALSDSDVGVRKQAAWALGQIESSAAVAGLSAVLQNDDNVEVRSTAAWALGQIESQDAVPALSAALSDRSVEVRKTAAWALGQVEPRTAPQALIDALSDENREVRSTAVWALMQIEDPSAVAGLRVLLNDEDPDVRMSAIHALARVGDQTAIEALAEMLQDDDPEVRRAAAAALGGGTRGWSSPRPRPRPRPQPRPRPRPNGGQ